MRLLIADKIDESALSLLQSQDIEADCQFDISSEQLLAKIVNYQGLIVRSRTKVTKEILEKGINLKIIGRVGSGVDNIDTICCKKKNIVIVNSPEANSQAVAEMTIGFMLMLIRRLGQATDSMKGGLWLKKELKGEELCGKTIGVIGFGYIGRKVAKLASAFGCKVLYTSKSKKNSSFENIFQEADLITIHIPLVSQTRGLIGEKFLKMMKRDAYIINTSRGEIIDEDFLYFQLSQNLIKGAALDVFWQEPLSTESRWRKLDNVLLTPHIAASTREAMQKASIAIAEDIIRFNKGEPPPSQYLG